MSSAGVSTSATTDPDAAPDASTIDRGSASPSARRPDDTSARRKRPFAVNMIAVSKTVPRRGTDMPA